MLLVEARHGDSAPPTLCCAKDGAPMFMLLSGKTDPSLHCVQGQDDCALGAFEVVLHAGEDVDGVCCVATDPAVVNFLNG